MKTFKSVSLKNIKLKNGLVINEVIPYQWSALNDEIAEAEPSRAIENFKIAAGKSSGEFHGMVFQDSDVAKWLEAAAYSLALKNDRELRKNTDMVIDLIEASQEDDGYLNTYFSVKEPQNKWKNLAECHELYCSGHMLEAAVALEENCGDSRLLKVMKKNMDLIAGIFGPQDGKLKGYPGHQEIELALVRLYRISGEKKYLDLALYFIDERGKEPFYFNEEFRKRNGKTFWGGSDYKDREYAQVHLPVREQKYAAGHAVRAMYMYCAMADLALETGDKSLADACRTLWDNVTGKQMYLTGGIGPGAQREAFTSDYDLPNETAYNETCAAIGFAFWAQRMLHLDMDARYGDILEKLVYNGIPCGMSADGKRFFYVNPLQIGPEISRKRDDHKHVKPERLKWFGCACCPPNIARFFASAGRCICSLDDDGVYIHLYEESEIAFDIKGSGINLDISGEYPWNGNSVITVNLNTEQHFKLSFRVPGWCTDWECSINGEKQNPAVKKGYALIERNWKNGDRVELEFDMPVRLIRSHPKVHENAGKAAVMKGPVVYCLEEADNGKELAGISINRKAEFTEQIIPAEYGQFLKIETEGKTISYADADLIYTTETVMQKEKRLVFIPYFCWGNRGQGEMRVWVREEYQLKEKL